jgi:DNA-directed RNA polymerase subunit beta
MPVSILLKAIGMTPETILATFFVNDNFRLMDSGAQMEFVADRLKGEVARFDITDKSGKVTWPKRITARHTRELEQSGTKFISVPEDFLLGRVLAKNIVDPDTGEIIAKANEELTEACSRSCAAPACRTFSASTPTNWTRAPTSRRPCAPMKPWTSSLPALPSTA